ncbi:MAG TPA: virulence factor [Verrucomicrobiae bacterium]|jgi:hypothetical protein|nr:virulence factor [Verrucomicrobiae bacterium]
MAYYQILNWGGIPSQIKVWDDADELKMELPPRFAAHIDATAQARGLTSTEDYLAQWSWSDEEEREGDAATVAAQLMSELERKFPPG